MYVEETHLTPKGEDLYRVEERKYKLTRVPNPTKKRGNKFLDKETDFSQVIDFSDFPGKNLPQNLQNIEVVEIPQGKTQSEYFDNVKFVYHVKTVSGRCGYKYTVVVVVKSKGNPKRKKNPGNYQNLGLYFIPNPFTEHQQKFWIHKCMKEYTLGNPNNITNLQENKTLFTEWKKEIMQNLRWTSLGYHFQWSSRSYTEEKKTSFPAELATLVADLAGIVGYSVVAEAGIVNFYPSPKCQMGAHVDDSEHDMSKPIVSLSFGNSVVFLIGGRTKEVKPTALFIHSEDIVIMSGESRFCYHSIPRMISKSIPNFLTKIDENESPDWKDCREYISAARINLNCRQVRINP
eukprot:TRINITY_DN19937_c0_g1_i1.p1 TRINITY_DN19937_c0_g1~~TRINITY_DN19937_c0_g1_i1.p1  ORF type:complete len:348 (-),score=62.54 TRINITY_DN19937_c0_g1_i1:142-1185(-)